MKRDELKRLRERKFQLSSKLKLRNIFPGEWKSIYKGEGMEFAGTRPFEAGDNPCNIDFLTLAQSEEELVIERVETRQLRVYVFADYSGSLQHFEQMLFPQKPWIRDIAVELILRSAVQIYSPVSFYPFGLAKRKFFPPKMGERYCQEILDWIADEGNLHPHTFSEVEQTLMSLMRFVQPRNIVFFISDFKQKAFEGDFTGLLKKTVNKFDFIPVVIRDPLELEKNRILKGALRIKVRSSSQKNKAEEIYLTPDVLGKMQKVSAGQLHNLESNFKRLNIEHLVLDSASIDDCCRVFSDFFQIRKKTNR